MMRTILTAVLLTTGIAAPAAAALGPAPTTSPAPQAASAQAPAATTAFEVASIRVRGRTGGFGL